MAEIDPMRFHDAWLQKIDEDYARVKLWLEQCEQWESRLKTSKSIVDVVLHGPASIPGYQKRMRKLEGDRHHVWRRKAALLAAQMGMDDSFVSHLADEDLQCIQEHIGSASLRHTLVALQRRAATRQLEAQRDRYREALRRIEAHIATVSLQEDSEDRLLNLGRQREQVAERVTEIEQKLAAQQGEDGEPELPG